MTADVDGGTLASAWGSIPRSREGVAGLGSFTRTRVERIITLVVGIGCLALGAQALVAALEGGTDPSPWRPALELLVFVPLALMLLACFAGRMQRVLAAVFGTAYTIAIVLWPFAVSGVSIPPGVEPWPFYLLNVGTVAAVLAFGLPAQIVATAAIPVLWGIARLLPTGFDPAYAVPVALDVSFALILGGILVALGWLFRSVAANVDATRAQAVASYAAAAAAEATEAERVAVGALMHDSVLAALIAVERAESPRERALAVGMAREALTRLANAEGDAEMGAEEPVSADTLAPRIEAAAAELGCDLRVGRTSADPAVCIPGAVTRALILAAAQAVANAVEHAQGRGLRVSVAVADAPSRVTVLIRDDGPGFDVSAVPADRLGISASIVARMSAVGGRARVVSDATGTTVILEWATPA